MTDQTSQLALYHYDSCPFCVRVRQMIQSLGLEIELRNTQLSPEHRAELVAGGGTAQVPCLRIEEPAGDIAWLYESAAIGQYLQSRFSA